jgi:flagellar biosynthesis GTPase FlhF
MRQPRQATENNSARSAAAPRAIAQGLQALRAYQPPASPALATVKPGQATPASAAEVDPEQSVNPLRVISRELVSRGMAAPLVADLLAETVAEYGGQVLTDERAARLALVDILLSRIPRVSLLPSVEILSQGRTPPPLTGTFLVTGPAGAGKSTAIARLALWAARAGQREVTLVNTQGGRIGAAAQANALGAVFDYPVEHLYSHAELRSFLKRRRRDTLRLVELPAWTPGQDARALEAWLNLDGTVVACVPATGQGDDIHEALVAVRRAAPDVVAVLCKTSETRNTMPALGALTALRQHVGLVAAGPHLADDAPAPDFAAIVTAAICGSNQQRKQDKQQRTQGQE